MYRVKIHWFRKADKQKKLNPGVNEKLNKMTESIVYSYIHCFCKKNGIEKYKVFSSGVDDYVLAYIDIGQNKMLSIISNSVSCKNNMSYLPSLYEYAKKIGNSSVKVQSVFLNNWRYPKLQGKTKDDKAVQEYHTEIKKRLRILRIGCQIFGYKDYCRIKITEPKKISTVNARVSYSDFSNDLSALEDFLKNVIYFAEIPVLSAIVDFQNL